MVMDFCEEYHRGEVPFSSYHIRGYMISIGLITSDVNFDHMQGGIYQASPLLPFFPFQGFVTMSSRGIGFCLQEGGASRHLWTYVKPPQ